MTGRRIAAALAVAVGVLGAPAPIPAAGGAPLPDSWCGSDEGPIDRPDVWAPRQIHVVYAHPTDVESGFGAAARQIVRDLAGVDSWWRTQDPARTPRFDVAAFPGCETEFGDLDLSAVALSADSSAYDADSFDLLGRLADDLTRAGLSDSEKKYLVFYDGPASAGICGRSGGSSTLGGPRLLSVVFLRGAPGCSVGGYGTGNGWPARTVAHELLHGLNDSFSPGGAPNVCDDLGHVCDSQADIISTGTVHPSPRLSEAVLDVGNDDYYGHGGPWWDIRDSPWLAHLEVPPAMLSVVVAGDGGDVVISPVGGSCADTCTRRYDGGTPVRVAAFARAGHLLYRWGGACSGSGVSCDTTVLGDGIVVVATFGPAVALSARADGAGHIELAGQRCTGACTWDVIPGSLVRLRAEPAAGARFARWEGLCAGAGRTCTVAVMPDTGDPRTAAVFRPVRGQRPRTDGRDA